MRSATDQNASVQQRQATTTTRQVIFTADDFGRSDEINAAVLRAHREGVLTSASIMAGGEAFDEAVAIAKANPSLAVGLHVAVTAGKSVLPICRIPSLVDYRGRFRLSPFQAGVRMTWSKYMRWQVVREMRAQFEKFLGAGLTLSHVDGHQEMHCHPAVFNTVVPLAEEYGARAIRVPRDELLLSYRHCPSHALAATRWAFTHANLALRCRRRLADSPLIYPRRVYGLLQTGRMTETYVLHILRRVRQSPVEIYFHPTTGCRVEPLGPNPGELDVLLSPRVRQALAENNLQATNYLAMRPD